LGEALDTAEHTPCPRRRGGRVAEGGGLLNRYRVSSSIVSSNLIPSANTETLIISIYYKLAASGFDPRLDPR
jgi:hypothetical protein